MLQIQRTARLLKSAPSKPLPSPASSALSQLHPPKAAPSTPSAPSAPSAPTAALAAIPTLSPAPTPFLPAPSSQPAAPPIRRRDASHLDFEDGRTAFESRSTLELIRAWAVFKVSSFPIVVKNSRLLLSMSQKILGKTLTNFALKHTFFGHFCAGEDAQQVHKMIDKLRESGIGSILDYAAEADVNSQHVANSYEKGGIVSRVYEYSEESQCDANLKTFLSCIDVAAARPDGFAAIKVTALGKPELLQRISSVIKEIQDLFQRLSEQNHLTGKMNFDIFREGIRRLNIQISEEHLRETFNMMDTDNNGQINFTEWIEFLKVNEDFNLPFFTSHYEGEDGKEVIPRLTPKEKNQMKNMFERLEKLAEEASRKRVRLMIDAEQSHFQTAIDHLTLNLQRKYNKKFPVIFHTYQTYLIDSADKIRFDLEKAQKEGFIFAAKIVRGAYMVQERRLAEEKGEPDPIHPSIEKTHENYDRMVEEIVRDSHPTEVMIASHNEDSVKKAAQILDRYGGRNSRVFFGQLLGMCDPVSYSLGRHGYGVYKYLPYGPVNEVLPYLVRRAEENNDILGRTTKERDMLRKEILRRLSPF